MADITGPGDIIAPLFVPGDRPERFVKAAQSGCDAVIVDLEDAVAPASKERARAGAEAGFTDLPVLLRINGIGTPWHEADMAVALRKGFAGIVVPKAESNEAFAALCSRAAAAEVPIVALVETATGVADARRLAAMPQVARIAFGSIDFSADIGCAHEREALHYARSELVIASRAGGKPAALDGVTTSVDDIALVRDDARYARALGMRGKLCIHPKQIAAVREGFLPDAGEVAWAKKILSIDDAGAASVDGAMVDEPVRKRAAQILHLVKTVAQREV